jgi:hypothetical protein
MPKRRQRGHGILPAGFIWREGRPRWNPSPTRRRQGWRATDLKDGWNRWLAQGAAIERAQAIADQVAAWAAGEPVSPAFAGLAPRGALEGGATPADLKPRSIGALLEAYFASPRFTALAEKTRSDYRLKIDRTLGVIAAHERVSLEKFKAIDVDILVPPAFGEEADFGLELAYEALREDAGEHMAHGSLAATSAWLGWCVKRKRVLAANPATFVERTAPEGRIVVYDWPEIVALVEAADRLGFPSIADAIVMAIDLSWSQQDLLAITWDQVSEDGHVKHRRIKTGVAGNPPLLALGQRRLEAIRCRWQGKTVRPIWLIVCELTCRRWAADTFRHHFALVRAEAAKKEPGVATKQFRDTRDTAITYAYDAGLAVQEICSRSLHRGKRAQAVIEKHYGAIGQALTDGAAKKLDAHFAALGYTLEDRG